MYQTKHQWETWATLKILVYTLFGEHFQVTSDTNLKINHQNVYTYTKIHEKYMQPKCVAEIQNERYNVQCWLTIETKLYLSCKWKTNISEI